MTTADVASAQPWAWEHTLTTDLPELCVAATPQPRAAATLCWWNDTLAVHLGIESTSDAHRVAWLGGGTRPPGAQPVACRYAGHQFGSYNATMGDGRALLLGELSPTPDTRYDIALKGSGRTPLSRRGDGQARLAPMLREVLWSEFFAALKLPTTRSLAVVATGETVQRTDLGPGAVLTRTAASHLRFGTFQYVASASPRELADRLLRYTLNRHFPHLAPAQPQAPVTDLLASFLAHVAQLHARLVAEWLGLGFIHGVMNTDNMSICGETIDYGPCAMMETFDPDAVFSQIDTAGRYRFSAQPTITQWNLARLAEALLPMANGSQETYQALGDVVAGFETQFQRAWLTVVRRKMHISEAVTDSDVARRADQWLQLLAAHRMDYTHAWQWLADRAHQGQHHATDDQVPINNPRWPDGREVIPEIGAAVASWLPTMTPCGPAMTAGGPCPSAPRLVARNHAVERALTAAESGEYAEFLDLLAALQNPFSTDPRYDRFRKPAPPDFTECYATHCGT